MTLALIIVNIVYACIFGPICFIVGRAFGYRKAMRELPVSYYTQKAWDDAVMHLHQAEHDDHA